MILLALLAVIFSLRESDIARVARSDILLRKVILLTPFAVIFSLRENILSLAAGEYHSAIAEYHCGRSPQYHSPQANITVGASPQYHSPQGEYHCGRSPQYHSASAEYHCGRKPTIPLAVRRISLWAQAHNTTRRKANITVGASPQYHSPQANISRAARYYKKYTTDKA